MDNSKKHILHQKTLTTITAENIDNNINKNSNNIKHRYQQQQKTAASTEKIDNNSNNRKN